MSVELVTFGCRLNAVESDAIRAAAAGEDDLTIVNTCAVTAEAARQAVKAIRKAARDRPDRRIVVTGCAAQIEPARFAAMPEVARVVGNEEKMRPDIWARTGPLPRVAVGDIMAVRRAAPVSAPPRHVRATLAVQNGCDHRCTFCVIPFGRGNARSLDVESAVAGAGALVEAGAREIVLTGVDLTSYEVDGRPGLGRLVKAILAACPDLPRLRLSSIDGIEADADLLDALATEPRLMPHLHLSLQAGDDMVLTRMKRRHRRADAAAFCDHVRRLRPDAVFGADLIAGFPTETDAMFARTLDLVADCGLTYLHVFPYSARPGTPAARMPCVPQDVVTDRARRLRQAGADALARHLAGEVGRTRSVLVESRHLGRTAGFSPVRFADPQNVGEIREVLLGATDGRELAAAQRSAF